MDELALFQTSGIFLWRFVHYVAGVIWIGLLYYFNFVQMPFFAEADAATKSSATQKLVPRALWWFRWAALITFISGLMQLGITAKASPAKWDIFLTSWGVLILIGSLFGTLMFLNVWLVIWPNQKIVIGSAQSVAGGGAADPRAANAATRAMLASRTNAAFSIPMLFFMGAASHLPLVVGDAANFMGLWIAMFLIAGAMEIYALIGKPWGPYKSVGGILGWGFGLCAVVYFVSEMML